MKTLPEAILSYAFGAPEGQVFSPKDFLHLGNRTAVDKALSRLSGEGSLFRVDRGAYVWAAAGFKDTLLRLSMKQEIANGNEKAIQPGVQG